MYQFDLLKTQTRTVCRDRGILVLNEFALNNWRYAVSKGRDPPGSSAQWATGQQQTGRGLGSSTELAGALIICRINDTFNVPYAMSHSRFLCDHVNNAIFYAVSCNMLEREGVKGIFYTVQSLDAPANIDEFKFRMGFKPTPVRQRVAFHPLLSPFANKAVHSLTQTLLQRDPSNPKLAKAEGMLRFHVEGSYELSKQPWPECLERRHYPRIGLQARRTTTLQTG
jgi:hypothetical protein